MGKSRLVGGLGRDREEVGDLKKIQVSIVQEILRGTKRSGQLTLGRVFCARRLI